MEPPSFEFRVMGRGASIEEIRDLEQQLDVTFPEDYVAFAMKYAGSSDPVRSDYYVADFGGAAFGVLFDIVPGETETEHIRFEVPSQWFRGALPRKVVPIIRGGGPDLVCIDCREPKPKIVFSYPGIRPEGEEVVPLADSFIEFLGMLTEPNDPE